MGENAETRLLRMLLDVVEMDPFTFKVRAIGVRPERWDIAHGGVEHRDEPGHCSLCSAIAEIRAFLALARATGTETTEDA